jgi:hypothetical protein
MDATAGRPAKPPRLEKKITRAATRVENYEAKFRSGGRGGLVDAIKESPLLVLGRSLEREMVASWTKNESAKWEECFRKNK